MFSGSEEAPANAFDAEVLRVRAHPCDRDYEHYERLYSCNPVETLLRAQNGQAVTYKQGLLTQTYRNNRILPVVKHNILTNPALGFLGIPKLYSELGYGTFAAASTTGPLLKPCSSFGICATQAAAQLWYVNGNKENERLVTDGSVTRAYSVEDMISCGSMGFKDKSTTPATCIIDAAVVPLFYVYCKGGSSQALCNTYTGGKYSVDKTAAQLQAVANDLNSLLQVNKWTTPVATWDQYITGVNKIIEIHTAVSGKSWISSGFSSARVDHAYTNGQPRGLYYLLSYGAYEFPLAWWWRCTWLSGIAATASPAPCDAWDNAGTSMGQGGEVYSVESVSSVTVSIKLWLASANGVFLGTSLIDSRNRAHQKLATSVPDVPRIEYSCYHQKKYLVNRSDSGYQFAVLNVQDGVGWNSLLPLESGDLKVDATKNLVSDVLSQLLSAVACTPSCKCTTNLVGNQKCSLAQDISPNLESSTPRDQSYLPLFTPTYSPVSVSYAEPGCNTVQCCKSNTLCSGAEIPDSECSCINKSPSAFEITSAGLTARPTESPLLTFSTSSSGTSASDVSFDICGSTCSLGVPKPPDDCSTLPASSAQEVRSLYCGGSYTTTESLYEACIRGCDSNIGSRYAKRPSGINLELVMYRTPIKGCFTLSCPANSLYAQYDGTTSWIEGFKGVYLFTVESTQVEMELNTAKWVQYFGIDAINRGALDPLIAGTWDREYTLRKLKKGIFDVYVSLDGAPRTKVMQFTTDWCDKDNGFSNNNPYTQCLLNSKGTRYSGQVFQAIHWDRLSSEYPALDDQKIKSTVQKIISETEDYFSDVESKPICLEKIIPIDKLSVCVNKNISINSTEVLNNQWANYVAFACDHMKYTKTYMDQFCPQCCWKRCNNDMQDNYERVPANELCPRKWGSEQVGSSSFKFSATKTVYKGLLEDACTLTPKNCTFDSFVEQKMRDAGLPNIGFCPSCVGADCPGNKQSGTYNLMRSKLTINDIIPTNMGFSNTQTTGTTPADSKHFYLKMNPMSTPGAQQPICNLANCANNMYKVDLYKGLSVCINCKLMSPVYCKGQHQCKFLPWNWPAAPLKDSYPSLFSTGGDLSSVINGVKANVEAALPNFVGVKPTWHDFLTPFSMQGGMYNPQDLDKGYNDNIVNLRGYCSANSNLPVFTDCQNDGPRRTLRSFVNNSYKVADGSTVPSKHTLTWFASKFLSTTIVTWHSSERSAFFNELFSDTMCKKGTISNLICMKEGTTYITVNPVLSGRFEVQEGCDVVESDSSRVIDALCNIQACPVPQDSDVYNTFQGNVYTDPTKQTRCKLKNGATSGFLSTPKSFASNLCSKTYSVPSTCSLKQGMLGHTTWDGAAVSSVYSRLRWPATVLPSGLLSQLNPLLAMKKFDTKLPGNLTLDPWDIGGHYIRMQLDDALMVVGMPLRSYTSLSQASALPHVDWVASWYKNRGTESRATDPLYVLRTCSSWDCPLRRRFFWSGKGATFRPYSPSPQRNFVMYGTATHPTTISAPVQSSVFSDYKTRNGFCLLQVGLSPPASGTCSASDTINSLSDLQYRSATVLQTSCSSQVDWPDTGGTLRDQTTLTTAVSNCGVLDRLPSFQYRYHNSETILDNEKTTLDEGGDCHTGRPASYNAGALNCTLVEKREFSIIVNCGSYNITLDRPKSASVTKVGTCAMCDPLPTFKSSDGTQISEPEMSYGKLWRWAPSRKLYQDLRFRLCGNDTQCPALRTVNNLDSFWQFYINGGLTGTPTDPVSQLFAAAEMDPDAWTTTPWMLCTTVNGVQDCQGSASKRSWLLDRSGTCSAMKSLPNAQNAVASLTVCDLDENMDRLCRVIQQARYRLFEANCQLEGSCRTSSFFYQPATYSVTNDQLVRETVKYFYDYSVSGSCPSQSQEELAIITQNRRTAQECSAESLQIFTIAIDAARAGLHSLVKILYYLLQIVINFIGLLSSNPSGAILKTIMGYITKLGEEFKIFFQTMGDVIYKILFESGQLGKFMRELIMGICQLISDVVEKFIRPTACFWKVSMVGLISGIQTLARGFTLFLYDFAYMDKWKEDVERIMDCNFANNLRCTELPIYDGSRVANLPMPTRCWMGYKPTVGEQKGLGCSGSDTCMDDNGQPIVCASCSGGTSMDRYGCDALTKLCKCHVFPVGKTQCSTHQECQLPDTECSFVDAYLTPSFGNVPCSRCTQRPICLVSGGTGSCVCTLRSTALQTCSVQYHAQRISPDPTQLCLVSLGISASSTSSYSANYKDLASAPCATLNGGQTWCLNVWLDKGAAYMAVGLSLLRGRRLLSAPEVFTNWTAAHEPCRSLMEATTPLSILESHVAADCEKWRMIGERSILLYNLTNVSDVQFTSYLGLAEANLPFYVYVSLLQYAEWVQPVVTIINRINFTSWVAQLENIPSAKATVAQVHDLVPWYLNSSHHNRRLMHWKDSLETVKEYSVQIASGSASNLAPDLANGWNKGPFFWPPNYEYWKANHTCLVGSLAFNLTYKMMQSTVSYYTKTGPPRAEVDRTFQGALPVIKGSQVKSNVVSWVQYYVGLDLSTIKTYVTSVNGAPSQFSEDLSDLIRCDFEKVQHCTHQKRSLIWGTLVVGLFFVFLGFLGKSLMLPMVEPILIILFFPSIFFYVFGVSVVCFPMVPTCLTTELMDLIEKMLPSSLPWPELEQHWNGCADGVSAPPGAMYVAPGTAGCFKSCYNLPFEYQTWEDNVAWIQCDLGFCSFPEIDWINISWVSTRYLAALKAKAPYLAIPEKRQAQRWCCAVTAMNLVPVLLVLFVAVAIVLTGGVVVLAVVRNLFTLALSLWAFTHHQG
jgi:hypothetical protein